MSDVKNLNLRSECVNDMDTKEIISTYYRDLEIVQDFILDMCNHPDDTKDKAYIIFLKPSDKEFKGISFASNYDQLLILQSFINNLCKDASLSMKLRLGSLLQDTLKNIEKEIGMR